ncbi:cysteine-rich receptor-like protein kinase 25 isoform X4 [Miscanthus floridulus]|uniref:cysteine-rich receptor-like protein kinase 25 isoform X4 n=1 Tax=Miscanthus floridulus TaxID=154761 RepID=UPI00345A3499
MDTQANEPSTLQDLLLDDIIGDPISLKLSVLETITKNFSEEQIIGSGAYGTVYKGVLGDGFVAVKKLYSHHVIEDTPFQREVDCLMRIRHHNIVWFVGYCAETRVEVVRQGGKNIFAEAKEKLLCFEYLHNGSLRSYVTDEPCGLQWQVCYKIIKGICLGLQYLHEMNIIHLDLKPDNILLDDDMMPKIADFGLSRFLDEGKSRTITQEILGTRGYIAPEYLDNGVITVKADIYSLGVMIRHMVMGRNNQGATTDDVLKSWAIRMEQEPSEMRRTPLEIDYYRQIEACMEISESCIKFEPDNRPPTIADILRRLVKTEAKDQSVVTGTPALGRISSLAKLMEGLRLMASQHPSSGGDGSTKALVSGPPLLASPNRSGDPSPDLDKISWLDRKKSAKCYMLSSRLLHIEHVDIGGYWKWINRSDSRFAECAELIKVYFLAVIGEILTTELSPGTTYAVYLVYKLASDAAGLNGVQTSSVRLYGERTVTTSSVSVDPAARTAAAGMVRPVARQDGWMELKLAEFAPDDKLLLNEKAVIVDFREENIRVLKSGLIVEGMEFRPRD